MPFEGACPYFKGEFRGYLYCEICRFKFTSKQQRRDLAYKYCGSVKGYEKCTVKQILDKEYERILTYEQAKKEQKNKKGS